MREIEVFKADDGYDYIPILTEEVDEAVVLSYADLNPDDYLWKSGGGYLQKIMTTTLRHASVAGTPYGGDYSVENISNIAVVAYTYMTGDTKMLCVAWYMANNGDTTDILNRAHNDNFGADFYLYRDTYANASDYLEMVELDEWDDTPLADGETTEDNFGGEYADLMPFDDTDNQGVSYQDLLTELGWDGQLGLDPYDSSGNCGFFTPYVLSEGLLKNLGYCMFSSSMWNTISQWFSGIENPLSGFLRVLDFPCSLPNGTTAHKIAICGQEIYYEASPGSERLYATGYHLTSRYRNEVLGTISLKEVWGTARDYTDTNVSIYLPFVGMRDLDPQLCVGRNLTLLLRIDCWTGDVVYILHVDNDSIGGKWFRSAGYVYRWMGNCASEIPLGRIDNDKGLTTLLGGLGGMAYGIASGNPLAIVGGGASALGSLLSGGIRKSVQTSGTLTGNTGALDVMYPYLVVQRAVPNYPNGWRNFIGAPKSQRYKGSDLSGFTVFESIHLDDLEGASEEEINELERVLTTEGIIF